MPQEAPLFVTCGTNPPIEVPPHVYRLLQQLPDAVATAADPSNAPLVPLNFSGRNAQDEFLTLITDIICRHRQSIEDFFAVRENLEKSEVLRSKLKGSISDFLENKIPKLEKENEELRKENATLHSELDAARKVTAIQHQFSPPVVNQEEISRLAHRIKRLPATVIADFLTQPNVLSVLPFTIHHQLANLMACVEKLALAPIAPPSEETFDKSLVNLIGRLNALKLDVADPAFKAEIAAIKSLREFLNENYYAKLKAVKAKERKMTEVVLALKLTVNEVQGKLDCSSLKVKELEGSMRSQEIANVAKEVMNTMIMEIEVKEQEDKHDIQLAEIARRNEKDLQKAINKLEEENKAKTDEMEQLHRDQLKALQEKLAAKAEEAESLRKADNEKQRTMDFWKQEIPKLVGNYSKAAGKRQRIDDDEAQSGAGIN